VVDDKEAARAALKTAGITPLEGPFLDFRDPWGNRIEIVGYDNIQFTRAPNVLRGMGLTHLTKNKNAQRELAEKGMALSQATRNVPRTSTDSSAASTTSVTRIGSALKVRIWPIPEMTAAGRRVGLPGWICRSCDLLGMAALAE